MGLKHLQAVEEIASEQTDLFKAMLLRVIAAQADDVLHQPWGDFSVEQLRKQVGCDVPTFKQIIVELGLAGLLDAQFNFRDAFPEDVQVWTLHL